MAAQGALYQWNLPLAPKAGNSTNKRHRDNVAAVAALQLAEAVEVDEKSRLDMPKWTHPSVESNPYG
jgi:hypothetical protein